MCLRLTHHSYASVSESTYSRFVQQLTSLSRHKFLYFKCSTLIIVQLMLFLDLRSNLHKRNTPQSLCMSSSCDSPRFESTSHISIDVLGLSRREPWSSGGGPRHLRLTPLRLHQTALSTHRHMGSGNSGEAHLVRIIESWSGCDLFGQEGPSPLRARFEHGRPCNKEDAQNPSHCRTVEVHPSQTNR